MTGPATRERQRLEVFCWCGRRMGAVPRDEVVAGRTFSCGKGCTPESLPLLDGFTCPDCGDSFDTEDGRAQHRRRRHGRRELPPQYPCGLCGVTFGSRRARANHYGECTGCDSEGRVG